MTTASSKVVSQAVQDQKTEASVNLVRFPIAEGAWDFYNKRQLQGDTLSVRQFLPMRWGSMLSEFLGRQLTIEDLEILVHPDGKDQVVCGGCKGEGKDDHKFFPVIFTNIPASIGRMKKVGGDKILHEENLVRCGSFLVFGVGIVAMCGSPFWFDPRRFTPDGLELMTSNRRSHLGMGYSSDENMDPESKKPRSLRTFAGAQEIASTIQGAIEHQNSERAEMEERRARSRTAVSGAIRGAFEATENLVYRPGHGRDFQGGKRRGINGGSDRK